MPLSCTVNCLLHIEDKTVLLHPEERATIPFSVRFFVAQVIVQDSCHFPSSSLLLLDFITSTRSKTETPKGCAASFASAIIRMLCLPSSLYPTLTKGV